MKHRDANAPSPRSSRGDEALKSNGWQTVKLGEVVSEIQAGFAAGQRDPSGTIQLRMNNVTTSGTWDWASFIRVPAERADVEFYSLRAGDVLFNNTNSTEMVGKSAVFDGHPEPVVFSNHFTRIRTDPEKLDPHFLGLWFSYLWRKGDFARLCDKWIGQSAIQRSKLLAIELPLPPLAEQRRMAGRLREQLAAVAQARAAVQAQLDAAQALPAAHLRAVFNSPTAQHWPKRRIGDLAKVQSGYAFKSEWFSSEGIRLLRNVNVAQGRISWEQTACLPTNRQTEFPGFELNEGDIILSLDRPVVAGGLKLASLTRDDVPSLLLQRVGRFQIHGGVLPDFLYHFLCTDDFISAITEHDQSLGVPHVSPKQVEATAVPLPPLNEQRAVSARLDAEKKEAASLTKTLTEKLTALDHLPAALLRAAFGGGRSAGL